VESHDRMINNENSKQFSRSREQNLSSGSDEELSNKLRNGGEQYSSDVEYSPHERRRAASPPSHRMPNRHHTAPASDDEDEGMVEASDQNPARRISLKDKTSLDYSSPTHNLPMRRLVEGRSYVTALPPMSPLEVINKGK